MHFYSDPRGHRETFSLIVMDAAQSLVFDIAIVRATHLCLRDSRIPTSRMSRLPQWEDTAGLSFFRH
jgi:hypothetical protein